MVNKELSDLFFNYPHPHFEEQVEKAEESTTPAARHIANRLAILQDAKTFVESYPMTCGFVTPTELANDFLKRL